MQELIAALPALISLVNMGIQAIQDSQEHTEEEKKKLIEKATNDLHASFDRVKKLKWRDVDAEETKPTPPLPSAD